MRLYKIIGVDPITERTKTFGYFINEPNAHEALNILSRDNIFCEINEIETIDDYGV